MLHGGGTMSKGRLLSQVWKAFKELNPKNVAEEAERAVRVGVVGPTELIQEAAAYLLGEDLAAFDQAGDVLILLPTPLAPAAPSLLPKCDAVLRADHGEHLPGVAKERVFEFASINDLPGAIKKIVEKKELGYAHIALARALPAFRRETAMATVQTISIENSVFVASTSLGNVIPNPLQPLTSVAESLGDIVVLTANQVRMLFRLAAMYDRGIGFRPQAPEVASILGAAFGWRSVARSLAGKIPFGGGVVPKAAIAFAGTWAIGDGIIFYYTTGRKLTQQEMRQRFDLAYERGREVAEVIAGRMKDAYSRGRAKLAERPREALGEEPESPVGI